MSTGQSAAMCGFDAVDERFRSSSVTELDGLHTQTNVKKNVEKKKMY